MKTTLKLNKKGFTLIELILVIVIIAILAAAAIPPMVGLRRDARISAGESNARTIYTAVMAAVARYPNEVASQSAAAPGSLAPATAGALPSSFREAAGDLLGRGFPGAAAWEAAGGNIVSVTWFENAAATGAAGDVGVRYDVGTGAFTPLNF